MAEAGLSLRLTLADEAATVRLAEDLAIALRPGDVVRLEGDLGAGKSTLARALLRALADNPALEVPSPTFTLVQPYALPRFPVVHADLYRLASPDELTELGLDEAAASGAVLVEWPERDGDRLPAGATLALHLEQGSTPDARIATLATDAPDLAARLARSRAVRAFLEAHGWADGARRYLQGDASTRAYEKIRAADTIAVLMNHPPEPDTPKGRDVRAYYAAARLADNARPFVAIGQALIARGLSAPRVLAADVGQGLLLLEDLGSTFCIDAASAAPIPDRYAAAIDVLAHLHANPLPGTVPDGLGGFYALPSFDATIFRNEVSVLCDWGIEYLTGRPLADIERARFLTLWAPLFEDALAGPQTWCLRDYHSPNLLWLADRSGPACVGLLDYQDAVIGPEAYDVASLAQDARVTVPPDLETALVDRYVAARRASGAGFDETRFRRVYAIVAAQRNTRLLGLWARLLRRDGKPGYLRHYPRTSDYLDRCLAHPALADLAAWFATHLPADVRRSGVDRSPS